MRSWEFWGSQNSTFRVHPNRIGFFLPGLRWQGSMAVYWLFMIARSFGTWRLGSSAANDQLSFLPCWYAPESFAFSFRDKTGIYNKYHKISQWFKDDWRTIKHIWGVLKKGHTLQLGISPLRGPDGMDNKMSAVTSWIGGWCTGTHL